MLKKKSTIKLLISGPSTVILKLIALWRQPLFSCARSHDRAPPRSLTNMCSPTFVSNYKRVTLARVTNTLGPALNDCVMP